MRRLLYCLFLLTLTVPLKSQPFVFAHNDYGKLVPFFAAYRLQADYIEADIFLRNGELLVAHTSLELDRTKTIEALYLKPLHDQTARNNGNAYAVAGKTLTLMIDLKTEGTATLNALIGKLKTYPLLTTCNTLFITISGRMPAPETWPGFPGYIHFDGRPGISYTTEQLQRVRLISLSFKSYSHWNGKGSLKSTDREKLQKVIDEAHALNKPVRFWASPDLENAWTTYIDMKIDIINTDHIQELASFLNKSGKEKE